MDITFRIFHVSFHEGRITESVFPILSIKQGKYHKLSEFFK